ncbi:hypothetical protein E2562_009201 [Oryza meyeriana var. granulata]|uniref:Uncharacterized protein n=1 Tax=Oryza meyeriana var. granulata TaxID=110450 RepID=A0A6G1D1C7_9ORYZ|nr:hypothetical protein E2562_009201 [Oryza meyeriana var. granulata]
MPPQFPTSRVKSTPATAAFSSSIAAAKKPSSLSSQSPAKKIMPRPTSAPDLTAAKKIARPTAVATKKPARPASGFSERPVAAVTVSVHPARRLTCGTAVYVRTRYVKITARCCLVIWLPARVVSSSDAYHYTVKYAADLHPMFAGRVVRVPVGHVRPAPQPHRA